LDVELALLLLLLLLLLVVVVVLVLDPLPTTTLLCLLLVATPAGAPAMLLLLVPSLYQGGRIGCGAFSWAFTRALTVALSTSGTSLRAASTWSFAMASSGEEAASGE
jgi:hypothetical protein